jgi:UDP-N-acetylglucosamine 2-epimerase (non-hydrolysing)
VIAVDLIAAARPNFMKVAPLYKALARTDWCKPRLVHTGQHYDANMSDAFFTDLGMPKPDVHLGVGSGSHAEQTGGVMIAYEKECLKNRPDWVIVVGDVNSTVACTLAATKLCIKVAHLEAGLRSRDRTMPEELNRLATDALAELLWTPSPDADENLLKEGIPKERIECVGNIMIDSFEMLRPAIERRDAFAALGLRSKSYGVATLHRPSNVDDPERLAALCDALTKAGVRMPIVFPVHPRTRERLVAIDLWGRLSKQQGVLLTDPVGYIDFMSLVLSARFVLTDSGGIQEETTYLGIPCMTLRSTTERPITVTEGTNRLIKLSDLDSTIATILSGQWPAGRVPALWDGKTAGRVAESLRARTRQSNP